MGGIVLDRILMAGVGLTFVGGGLYVCKSALDSKNLMEVALFGLMIVATGLFLVVASICGPPDS